MEIHYIDATGKKDPHRQTKILEIHITKRKDSIYFKVKTIDGNYDGFEIPLRKN